ncbi:MAG: Holliday junction branch migration protein RuvA [Pseudomonadota bacterium]
MIARLRGTVAHVSPDAVVLDVEGVGYEVNCLPRALEALSPGTEIVFSIETIVREDFIRLYGFASETERQCFRVLTGVQGVGARHALSILQILPPSALYDAIAAEDVTAISRAHGIGKKIAQRLVSELQSKLGILATETGAGLPNAGAIPGAVPPAVPGPASLPAGATPGAADAANGGASRADAVSALVNLGYDRSEAHRAVAKAGQDDDRDVETLITGALKELAIL